MKLDGSSVERINNTYSYGMFLYDEYLYYMRENPIIPVHMLSAGPYWMGQVKRFLPNTDTIPYI
jgi:hypothetical protein